MGKPRVLVVDDDRVTQDLLKRHLKKFDLSVVCVDTGEQGLQLIEADRFDVMLLDVVLPEMDGIEVLKSAQAKHPDLTVMMLTANASIPGAVEALQLGARDYFQKPLDLTRIQVAIHHALEATELRTEVDNLRGLLSREASFDEIIGADGGLRDVVSAVKRVTGSNVPVLIRGESGTGKELIAKAIHFNGNRRNRPFITINCSAIPDNLLESELFGHEKGAFTGAVSQKKGRFERANGGTLFLDEIGDMKHELQAKLLRVLQEQEIERVGGTETIRVDVRIISATHQDLEVAIKDGDFREDLFYRLSVYPVNIPPLRDRKQDLPNLAQAFLKQANEMDGRSIKGFTSDAQNALQEYDWPGNVRELQNVIRRAVVDCEDDYLSRRHLLVSLGEQRSRTLEQRVISSKRRMSPAAATALESDSEASQVFTPGQIEAFDVYERRIISRALAECDGDPAEAGQLLKLSRATIYRKIKNYNIDLKQFKS